VFVCKNGESRSFDVVYFIPCLTTNIMSVGHLKLTQPTCFAVNRRNDKVVWRGHERFRQINMAAL
jgi:hypothetical protein